MRKKNKKIKEYSAANSLKFLKKYRQKCRGFELVSPDFKKPSTCGSSNKSRNTKKTFYLLCLSCSHLMLSLSWDASQWCSTPVRSNLLHSFFCRCTASCVAEPEPFHQPRHKLCNYAEPPKPFSWTKQEDFDFSSSNFYTAGSHSTDHTAGDSLGMWPCSRNLTWDSWVESRESGRNPEKGLFTALQQWGPLQASPKHSQIVFLLTIPCFWLGR